MDIHDVKLDLFEKLKKGQYYEIPYRALVPNEISNIPNGKIYLQKNVVM
ncbi:hypothetical protein [Anaerovibrio sp.]